ncbi:MAG: hypothetical protein QM808_08535 [Steroidobacteraceae bacterium]
MPLPLKFERDPARIEAAVKTLLALRHGELQLECMPDDITPRTISEAQEVCDRVTAALNYPILGWKYYVSYKAQEHPFRSAIYRVMDAGKPIPRDASPLRLIEPEMMFRVLRDLPPRAQRYGFDEVADAMEAVPGFEVIGSRYNYPSYDEMRKRIAGPRRFDRLADHNACGAIILGKGRKDWRDIDMFKMRVTMSQGERVMVDTVGGHPIIDPFLPIFVLANDIRETEGLKAGQILVTSSYSGFYQVEAKTKVVATFDGFEPVETSFE